MLHSDRPPDELSHFTGFLLNWLGRNFAALLEPYGFHPREFGVLTVIARRPGVTQQELAAMSAVDPATMVAVLDELEARGLAERRRVPEDRRKYAISLTPAGEEMLETLGREARAAGAGFFGRLTSAENAELRRLLRKLAGFDEE